MARTYTLRNASGSKSVSLINTAVPGIIARKGGFGKSRLSEFIGRGQVVDEYKLAVQGANDDATAAKAQELFDLLIDAILYEKGVEDEPVYLQVQTTGETQTRFSRVLSWLELEHPDLFDFPFEGDDTIDPLIVTIARQNFWSDKRPGDIGTALALGASDGPGLDLRSKASDGLLPSTASGGLIPSSEHAAVGQSVQLAEATTNVIINPRPSVSLANGWSGDPSGGNVTKTLVADAASPTGEAIKCEVTGIGTTNQASTPFSGITIAAGNPITAQAMVKGEGSTIGKLAQVLIYASGGANPAAAIGVESITLTDDYQIIVVVATIDYSDRTTVSAYLQLTGSATNDITYWAQFQGEEKTYPTPYCDGSLGPGHSWSGAAHASTSSRVATDLRYTLDLPSQFTISTILTPFTLPSETSGYLRIFSWHVDANNLLDFLYNPAADWVYVQWVGNGTGATIVDTDLNRFQKYEYTITYDGTTLSLYRDGSLVNTVTPTAFTATPSTLYMGEDSAAGAGKINGFLDEFIVLDYVLTGNEVAALTAQGVAGTPHIPTNDTKLYLPFDGPQRAHLANFRDDVNITHAYSVDASGPTFTAISTGTTLFPAAIAQTDYLIFGSTDQFPKVIVIPRLGTAGALTTTTLALKYWNGSAWTALVLGTNYLCFPGPTLEACLEQNDEDIILCVQPPSNAAKTTLNAVDAFWVKLEETNAAPVYATRPVTSATDSHYAQSHPYVEIPAAAFSGDAPMKLLIRLRAPAGGDENPGTGNISRILIGARSRGLTKFVSHLNAGGDDNPADWTTTQKTDATATARPHAPAGKYCAVSYAGDSTMQPRIEWSGAGMAEYWEGEFMAIAVVQQVGGAVGDQNIKLRTYLNGTNAYDPHVDTVEFSPAMVDGGYELLDLGLVSIPFAEKKYDDDLSGMDLIFQLLSERTTGASTLEIIQLIMLPVKEGQSGVDDPVSDLDYGPSALRGATALDVDSGLIDWRAQKYVIDSSLGLHPTEVWVPMMKPIDLERLGQKTRLYFVIEHYPATWDSPPLAMTLGTCLVVEVFAHSQWLMLRGAD